MASFVPSFPGEGEPEVKWFVEDDRLLLFRQIHTCAFSFCMIFDPAPGFRIHYSASKAMGQFALTRASTKEPAAFDFGSR